MSRLAWKPTIQVDLLCYGPIKNESCVDGILIMWVIGDPNNTRVLVLNVSIIECSTLIYVSGVSGLLWLQRLDIIWSRDFISLFLISLVFISEVVWVRESRSQWDVMHSETKIALQKKSVYLANKIIDLKFSKLKMSLLRSWRICINIYYLF